MRLLRHRPTGPTGSSRCEEPLRTTAEGRLRLKAASFFASRRTESGVFSDKRERLAFERIKTNFAARAKSPLQPKQLHHRLQQRVSAGLGQILRQSRDRA